MRLVFQKAEVRESIMRMNEISADEMRSAIEDKLCAYFAVTSKEATRDQMFQACAMVIRELMSRLKACYCSR